MSQGAGSFSVLCQLSSSDLSPAGEGRWYNSAGNQSHALIRWACCCIKVELQVSRLGCWLLDFLCFWQVLTDPLHMLWIWGLGGRLRALRLRFGRGFGRGFGCCGACAAANAFCAGTAEGTLLPLSARICGCVQPLSEACSEPLLPCR